MDQEALAKSPPGSETATGKKQAAPSAKPHPPPPAKAPGKLSDPQWQDLPRKHKEFYRKTPRPEWYKLRMLKAGHEETVALSGQIILLDYILDVAPGRCISRMNREEISAQEIDKAWRKIRDMTNGLEEAMRHVCKISQLEIRAWKNEADPTKGSEAA